MTFKHACSYMKIEANNIIRNETPPEEGTGDDIATEESKGYLAFCKECITWINNYQAQCTFILDSPIKLHGYSDDFFFLNWTDNSLVLGGGNISYTTDGQKLMFWGLREP